MKLNFLICKKLAIKKIHKMFVLFFYIIFSHFLSKNSSISAITAPNLAIVQIESNGHLLAPWH